MTKKEFLEMGTKDRKAFAEKRMSGNKWIVFDYHPNKNMEYGVIEKCPQPYDRGFIHGFVFRNPSVCIHDNCAYDFEINCYWTWYVEDEKFETRTPALFHIFSTYEDAAIYADNVRKFIPRKITLEDVLEELHKTEEYKEAYITTGKRGYETSGKGYTCICSSGGWTTFKIVADRFIEVQFGQSDQLIIPHIDLITKAFENLKDGAYINYDYCEYDYNWIKFYGL